MRRLKGPDLKMPELKVPDFLSDLWWDLRDRHLLPLVALGVVAILAVPFLLGGDSNEPVPSPTDGAVSSVPNSAGVSAASLAVVEAKPGLRDYRKRLEARSATDPFEQHYTSPELRGTKLGGGEGESSSTTTTTTETSDGKTTTDESPGGAGVDPHPTLIAFAVDVKIVRTETKADGSKETSKPVVRRRVLPPAQLPSEKVPLVTYMGISPKTRMPFFMVSDQVTAIFGEAKCLSGAATCQLIEVEPGFPETFVYGPSSIRYKINVLKVELVTAGQY